jgi:hypothetical protein
MTIEKELAVPCRMNVDGKWSSGCIHDVSDHGLLMSSLDPPPAGTYIDIRRGTLIIIGRVVWIGGERFGVRTQDPVSAAALLNEPVLKHRPTNSDRRGPDRATSAQRYVLLAAQSARLSSHLQFVCLALAGAGLAGFIGVSCYQALVAPLHAITVVLGNAAS